MTVPAFPAHAPKGPSQIFLKHLQHMDNLIASTWALGISKRISSLQMFYNRGIIGHSMLLCRFTTEYIPIWLFEDPDYRL